MKNIPIVILVRVSTDSQQTQRQIEELQEYALKNDYNVIDVIEESISGTSDKNQRSGLQKVEDMARAGIIKKCLVHEVSRIARRNSVAHTFLETMEELGVSIYWHQHNIETLLPNGKRNPSASIMFSLLSELARNERETLVDRIKSGMRNTTKKIGRPKGSSLSNEDLLDRHRDIVRLIRRGSSIRHTARIVGKGTATVQKVKTIMKQEGLVA